MVSITMEVIVLIAFLHVQPVRMVRNVQPAPLAMLVIFATDVQMAMMVLLVIPARLAITRIATMHARSVMMDVQPVRMVMYVLAVPLVITLLTAIYAKQMLPHAMMESTWMVVCAKHAELA